MASVRKRSWKNRRGNVTTVWFCDWADERGERHRKQFHTKREADAFRIRTEQQLQIGTYRSAALVTTVNELAAQYLEHCAERSKRGEHMSTHTLAVYRGHLINYILDPAVGVGSYKLKGLTAARVASFRDRLRAAGVSVPTTRKILGTLRAMLAFAISRDLLHTNPVRSVRVIGSRAEQTRKVVPPAKADLTKLLDTAPEPMRLKILVAATTGVRAGEFHALRWRHVDFRKTRLAIETRVDAYGQEDVTKTVAGMRTVPISKDVLKQLRRWRARSTFSKDDDLIFPNRNGSYTCHPNMVKRHFKPLFAKLAESDDKAPAYFNWHALRHFAISCWIEAGLSPKTVQTFAGHASLQVTMDRYGHLFPAEEHNAVMDRIANDLLTG